ncbi:ABC transporter permease [Winogradskya humida]|uniref:ABC transporter permease n=1 Tax=Winogradskya humida TaxID=113566 RepID=A0ABQ3ZZZ2_9ACTN|nr:FtsX-like permease family protein [Actinoplanes humidus]GIE24186.1 ABC transporter permease [Actinoplanes humidus]
MKVLGTQLAGVARRPARLLLTGLAVLVASFVVYTSVLAQSIAERTVLDGLSGTPAAVDLLIGDKDFLSGVPIDTGQLAAAAKVPGVAEAVGRLSTDTQIGGENGQYLGVVADPGSGPLSAVRTTQGAYPTAPGQIAVTPRTADRLGLPVGSKVTVTTGWDDDGKPIKPVTLTVTGLVEGQNDYGFIAYAPLSSVTKLDGTGRLEQIDLRLAPGTDPATVQAALQGIVDAGPQPSEGQPRASVVTGAEMRANEAREAAGDIDQVFIAVDVFVAVAVLAAGLVAASTFRIVFAQRMRQLALLRAIGAGRGALWRALAAEGALTGFAVGVAGVLLALAAGFGIPPLVRATGTNLASPTLPLLPMLGVVLLAVLITVVAVIAPAFSAARVAPLEALRAAGSTQGKRGIGVLRGILGTLTALAAAAPAVYVATNLPGRDPKDYNPEPMLMAVVASGALAYLALIMLGPLIVRPVLALFGLPLRRLGPVGRLAVGGVGGAPRRAAAVSVVVALGVTLIAGVVVTGASVRILADRDLAVSSPADFEITAQGDDLIPADLLTKAQQSPDLAHVSGYRRLPTVRIAGTDADMQAVDLSLTTLPALKNLDVRTGTLADMGKGRIVLTGFAADYTGLGAGQTTTLTSAGHKVQVIVAAVLPDNAPLQASLLVDPADLTTLGAPAGLTGMLADSAKTGEDGRNAALNAVQKLTQGRTGLGMEVLADQRDQLNGVLNGVLAIAIGLVGLTVLIAVVGVGTTTALSVVERVRESGLLRAVGLSRAGLRTMLTTESALYGVLGAAIGLLLGVPYAWLAIQSLGLQAPLALPVWQLAAVFVALVVLTALAGVLPARRAAKVSPVAALATD